MGQSVGERLIGLSPDIRIINLEHRDDRRREMLAELEQLGLPLGDKVRFHAAHKPTDAGGFPSIGARGCFLSHLDVIQSALDEGLNSVMIFEDDLSFSREEIGRMPEALKAAAAQPWAIFYGGALGYDAGHMAGRAEPVFVADPQVTISATHFLVLRGDALQIAAHYLRAMLTRPTGSPEGGPMHVDGAYSWMRKSHPKLLTLVANPVLGHQRSSRTDIHDLGWHDRMPIVRHAVDALRRWRNAH